jgi:cytosine deaminase
VHDLVIRRARLWRHAGGLVDIAVDAGRVSAVACAIPDRGSREWSVGGRLLMPALADPHHHLDKAGLVAKLGASNDLADARARFATLRPHLTPEDLVDRGARIVRWAIRHGVSALRTHADTDRTVGLRHVEAALEVKRRFADALDLQVVAFQPASVALEDRESWENLEAALALGCDVLGGTTGTRGPRALELIERLLGLAAEKGAMVDLHLDETLDPAVQNLEGLARLTQRFGLHDRVAASHCCSLSIASASDRKRAIEAAAEARLHVIALPLTNLYLQGRDTGLRGVAPVAELLGGGVNVACGSDNVQDPFLPTGNADPLLAAQVLGLAAQIADPCYLLESVSSRALRAMGMESRGEWFAPGAPASFAVADCAAEDDPVACLAPRPLVVLKGRVVRAPGASACDLPPIEMQ